MVSAFVDLINRQRNDYVITLEGQIRLVHESRGSLISQREVRGSAAEIVTAARTALRENPDVLVIEDLRSPDVLQAALDAAGSGLLVFVSVTAASATAALERLVDLCPSEQRRNVRAALAEHLRGVVAQVLLRKAGGGRLAARELVLNTNAVAALVSDGQIAQLPRAIDSGRKLGMAPLNDALVAFVQSGAVDVREAYRKADDKVACWRCCAAKASTRRSSNAWRSLREPASSRSRAAAANAAGTLLSSPPRPGIPLRSRHHPTSCVCCAERPAAPARPDRPRVLT